MLQQTRIDTVIPYYTNFIKRFPNITELATSDMEVVLKQWEGLGYYARARNLHRAAKILYTEYGGKLPDSPEELIRLPGFGDYISAAVASIAFCRPIAVIDGNVKRILARIFMEPMPVNDAAAKSRFGELAGRILDSENPGQFNQAIMELGQRICKPNNPGCDNCPIKTVCKAFIKGKSASYPVKIPKKTTPFRRMVFAVVIRNKKLLITKRPNNGLLGGLWEFPGHEILPDQSGDHEAADMVYRKTGIRVSINRRLGNVRHAYTHFRVSADVYLCDPVSGRVKLNGASNHAWVKPEEMRLYPFHKMIHKILPLLEEKT